VKCVEGDGELLEILIDYISSDKKMNLAQYIGMETGELYTRRLLELAAKYAARSIKAKTPHIEYYGEFWPMGIWLEQTNTISSTDMNDYLWMAPHKIKIDLKCRQKTSKRR